ncbi:MAG: hypothetical protein WC632_05800 [Candidatus Margulisiibacteriota bacterium]
MLSAGLSKSIPFEVSISRNAPIPIQQAERIIAAVTQRLSRSPFNSFIGAKPINIKFVTSEEMDKLGYTDLFRRGANNNYSAPELANKMSPSGAYDPLKDTVFVNCRSLDRPKKYLEVLTHEFLHAYSTEITEIEPGIISLRSGLRTSIIDKANKRELRKSGEYLNEGLTEYLRILAGDGPTFGVYVPLVEAIGIVAQQVGIDLLMKAYFKEGPTLLERAFDGIHGAKAYLELSSLAHTVGTRNSIRAEARNGEDLAGFVRYGFEYYIMKEWNTQR